MSGIRALRSAEGNFTQLLNAMAQNPILSARGKGVILYALSCHPDTRHSAESIAACMAEGRDAIATTLKHLAEHGYYRAVRYQTRRGTWATDTFISDAPISDALLTKCMGFEVKTGKGQAAPEPDSQGSVPPAETPNPQVTPNTETQGSAPPAQTHVSAGRTETGFSGIKDLNKKTFNKNPPTPHDDDSEPPGEPEIKSGGKPGEIFSQPEDQHPQSDPGNDKNEPTAGDVDKAAETFMATLEKGPTPPSEYVTALLKAQIVRLMAQGASPSWIRSRVIESESMVGAKHFFGVWTKRASALNYQAAVPAAVAARTAPVKDWQAAEGRESRTESLRSSQGPRELIREQLAAKSAKLKALKEGKRPQLIGAR